MKIPETGSSFMLSSDDAAADLKNIVSDIPFHPKNECVLCVWLDGRIARFFSLILCFPVSLLNLFCCFIF